MDLSQMDLSGLDLSGLDLSGLDLGGLDLSSLDLSTLLSKVKFNVTQEQLTDLAKQLLTGYQEYATQHPEADISRLGEDFLTYLESDQAKEDLSAALDQLLEESGLTVSAQQLEELVYNVTSGYQSWAIEQGYENATEEEYKAHLKEYLQTPEAQKMLADGAAQIMASAEGKEITQEQLEDLAASVLEGYQKYAAENSKVDPTQIGQYFMDYLQTENAQNVLAAGFSGMVDVSGVTQWLSGQMSSMQQQLQTGISQAMTQAVKQIMEQVMQQMMPQVMKQLATTLGQTLESQITTGMESAMKHLQSQLQDAFDIDPEAFADAIQVNMTEEELSELLMSLMTTESSTSDGNLQKLGYADPAQPSSISIYPLDFETKEQVLDILDSYNADMKNSGQEEKVITYTDLVGTLMSSVTDIINIISYVLVAFVAISLVVSSIMIGVITYISVLERKKEIGILRAIGASKANVSQVFNAETFIIGLCAGILGIVITLLLLIPGNMLIHHLANSNDVNAVLPVGAAVILVALSVVLTLLGGLIPSRKAAKQDPVTALRTE